MSNHDPQIISWECYCGQPWPCDTRRRELVAMYAGRVVPLALFMSASMAVAMMDLPTMPSGVAYERFLGWIQRRTSAPRELTHGRA